MSHPIVHPQADLAVENARLRRLCERLTTANGEVVTGLLPTSIARLSPSRYAPVKTVRGRRQVLTRSGQWMRLKPGCLREQDVWESPIDAWLAGEAAREQV